MSLSIAEIENNLEKVFTDFNKEDFIYEFILSFGIPQATIKRLKSGKFNLADNAGELAWKKKVFFKELNIIDSLYELIDDLKKEERIKKGEYRFVILTNYKQWVAVDMKTADTLDCSFDELNKNFAFFLPLAGIEKAQYLAENPADVKAAERMAKLYDQINTDNNFQTEEEIHSLNVFLSRLLFCFFAEDTGIFTDQQFTHGIESSTNKDASDIQEYLKDLFDILNFPSSQRATNKTYLQQFPYVNGGLFKDSLAIPKISVKARTLILDCGRLDWKAINPDIFGSMIQAVVTTDKRGGLGMHYTSVPNIMKVINPLFLDDLKEIFEKAKGSKKDLNALLDRLQKIKIFDPACGSGNFLIIAYKELRLLEIEILRELAKVTGKAGTGTFDLGNEFTSVISLNNFYGIEIDDFAHEIARLSLWLAEHQMNQYFYLEFGFSKPSLPLKDAGHIVHANACRIDWEEVCPKKKDDEIYILGNPPYVGSRKQNLEQKEDLLINFKFLKRYKDLDYISIWFYKSSTYIKDTNNKIAFVTTNSICQGVQVQLMWPTIFKDSVINFAYQSFKWINNAKDKAGVTVVVIGLTNKKYSGKKYIFNDKIKYEVENINGYLIDYKSIYIESKTDSISSFPKINHGNMPADGGFLLLNESDINNIIIPQNWIKEILSVGEHLNGRKRYCLWLEDIDENELYENEFVNKRLQGIKEIRLNSSRPFLANTPHLFAQITQPKNGLAIIIPRVSSENREYMPISLIDCGLVKITDSYFSVVTDKISLFSILISQFHFIWNLYIGGKLETRLQYSKHIVYNTFPFPKISKLKEEELEERAYHILEVRERYPEKTLAQLYDPSKMPADLKEAHRLNDLVVESCYREKPFTSDEERLELLFKLYEKMIREEQKSK
ncbi:class I SAM-dependent DNA methyltransferase [Myroides marinus]|uniref:class I SAM-dependent DNA methyltransferase n=1 Tax=Myroides marinus TaxID=703342 RepID=UPI0025773344|nr:DNA methyltransferase [Myroides marinus]MDM1404508.1 class I SAM-dependent DNA methyltransferase [Myroides marinus]MDM1534237.1 class I SAM-dependent DNA methyltransferase [Myroides marinus]MDM1541201.1 class I SAM-dependent DNA methyltransferase [Myroides marinus]